MAEKEEFSPVPGDIPVTMGEEIQKRKPVIKESLAPVLTLMKLFGLYYEDTCEKIGWKKIWNKSSKIYSIIMLLVFMTAVGKSVAALFYQSNKDGYYTAAIFIIYYFKCTVQIYACLKISPCSQTCVLWTFIDRVQTFLDDIKLCHCRKVENNFRSKLKRWLYAFVGIFFTCVAANVFVLFYPLKELDMVLSKLVSPLPDTFGVYAARTVFEVFVLATWFLPVALCGVLTQSISYIFEEFFRYLKHRKMNGLCLRTYIKEIREKYVAMTTMCSDLDDMLSYIFMISYLTDIVLVCLELRMCVVSVGSLVSRFLVLFWCVPSLFSLVTLSYYSSRLVEKGEEMLQYIQKVDIYNVDMDAKVQLDLLLFHLSAQPVVLTIWKMIPLYKSIIVSIFVSIITYFTILIAF
ncbi:uncharacterized protein LOC130622249 isoform X1 [Hydractinia symbiolongicarpus]|uniref:uncharacterized protein LOC130622249 isoform X1 n=1 Tax=Hydractinia symbiolongicarpus TaxID=13093 RepID=UPI00254A1E40|nr:uncharacterized protein LOC130622249 isoform X1 [Hydractinia symbiolongicarpus]